MNSAAQFAKATLRRLALEQLEPTPENYARVWAKEAGDGASAQAAEPVTAPQWASLIERLVRGVERGGRQWTTARKKDSLRRVLDGNRTELHRLHDRLDQLVVRWDHVGDEAGVETMAGDLAEPVASWLPATPLSAVALPAVDAAGDWRGLAASLEATVRSALPEDDAKARDLSQQLSALTRRLDDQGADAELTGLIDQHCQQTSRWLVQRHHLVEQLTLLARELAAGIAELAENDSWVAGQAQALQVGLGAGDDEPAGSLSVRSIRATQALLAQTRRQQAQLKGERDRARDAMKALVHGLMDDLLQLGGHTGAFEEQLGHYAQTIEQADTLGSLATLVSEMVQASRSLQTQVAGASARLQAGQAEAGQLASRVRELEDELRQLSEEVSIDALTQVANRRGLAEAFDAECTRHREEGSALAVALIDLDNFKKVNDSLGHIAGDAALKALAARVRAALRPRDHVARFGGEEFVLLLPDTPLEQAQQTLTQLQRELTASLFLYEGREVFITFSAGVTAWRSGETMDAAIERADAALYDAKRAGKNRTFTL